MLTRARLRKVGGLQVQRRADERLAGEPQRLAGDARHEAGPDGRLAVFVQQFAVVTVTAGIGQRAIERVVRIARATVGQRRLAAIRRHHGRRFIAIRTSGSVIARGLTPNFRESFSILLDPGYRVPLK